MKTIGILGTGTMGAGIAQVAAQTDHDVIFWNRKQDSVDQGLQAVARGLSRLLKRERISQAEFDETLGRVQGVTAIEELKHADVLLVAKRDRLVFELCRGADLPVATVMSGGYGRQLEDTVDIHLATVRIAAEMAGGTE